MNKIFYLLLLINFGFAYTINPYIKTVNYDNKYSIKEKGDLKGITFSHKTTKYKIDIDFSQYTISFKDYLRIEDFIQKDFDFSYTQYLNTISLGTRYHHITAKNDFDLGNGNIYNIFISKNYSNFEIGAELYTSQYKHEQINQISSYLKYYTKTSTLELKLNNNKVDKNYYWIELSNLYFNKNKWLLIGGYIGDSRTSIKGPIIENSLDLIKKGFYFDIGIAINKNISIDILYNNKYYKEWNSYYQIDNPLGNSKEMLFSINFH